MTTFDYNGKKAVATGAGGAIGGEIARGLARAGAQVAIWDISPEAARAKAEEINADYPDRALPVECNACLLYTSPSPRDQRGSRMPSSA